MAQKPKSPLNVMFGAFIQHERKNYFPNLSVTEIARDELKMSVSLYKMTEAGMASFSLNRLLLLLETFKDSGIVFDRLLKFVGGQNIIDNLIANKKLTPQIAFEELAHVDEEFKTLYLKTGRYFDFTEDSREFKNLIKEEAINEVRRFLQDSSYLPITEEEFTEEDFNKELLEKIRYVPSLNIGLLFDFIKSFSGIIPLHSQEIASKWEEDNSTEFEYLNGIFEFPELIISKSNLEKFPHSHLLENNFKKVRYLFCEKSGFKNKEDIKTQYFTILNQCRKQRGLALITESLFVEKVSIEILKKKDIDSVKDLFRDPYSLSKYLQAFWVFSMKKNKQKIGFVGVVHSDVNVVYNLSQGDVIPRAAIFDKLWNNL